MNIGTEFDAPFRLILNGDTYSRWSYVEHTTTIVKQRKTKEKNYAKYVCTPMKFSIEIAKKVTEKCGKTTELARSQMLNLMCKCVICTVRAS